MTDSHPALTPSDLAELERLEHEQRYDGIAPKTAWPGCPDALMLCEMTRREFNYLQAIRKAAPRLLAAVREMKADIEGLNQMLRAHGYGQGSIDTYVAQCEEMDKAQAEISRLRSQLAALKESNAGDGLE